MELTKSKQSTEGAAGDHGAFDTARGRRRSDVVDASMVDLHWEIAIAYCVPDDQSRVNRLRWLVRDVVGLGNPPLKTVRVTAEEITTVRSDEVAAMQNRPNRKLVQAVPHPRAELHSRDLANLLGQVSHT